MSGGRDPVTGRRGRPAAGGIAAAAGMIAVLTLLARATGFARWFVFSGAVGTTCVGNVYNAANTLPNVLYEVAAGGVLAAVAVPLIARALSRGDEAVADRIASALLTWAVTLLVPLAALLFLLAGPISELLLVRTSQCPGAQQLGADMIRVFAPQVPLYGIGIVLAGVLQAHRRFLAAALAPLLSSLVVIGAYLLYGALAQRPRRRPRLAAARGHPGADGRDHARGRGAEPAAVRPRAAGRRQAARRRGASRTASRVAHAGSPGPACWRWSPSRWP